MKKFLSLFIGIGFTASISVMAQTSFTISPNTLNVGGQNSDPIEALSTVVNNTTDPADSMFTCTFISYSIPSSWVVSFCDPSNCHVDIGMSKVYSYVLRKGASNVFKGDFDFQSANGVGSMKVVVKSNLYPSNVDTITYNATSWSVGVNEVNKTKQISFYPNPVRDQINFNFPTKVNVDIYNILGTKVKTFVHDGNSSVLNVSDLQNGVYFIRVNDRGTIYSKSFTKSE